MIINDLLKKTFECLFFLAKLTNNKRHINILIFSGVIFTPLGDFIGKEIKWGKRAVKGRREEGRKKGKGKGKEKRIRVES